MTLQLLSVGIPQQLRLLQDLVGRQVPHADGLRSAVNVVSDNDWVLAGTGRDSELDLGVGGREFREKGLDEAAATQLGDASRNYSASSHVLHALGASSPVAVVEVQLLALENE